MSQDVVTSVYGGGGGGGQVARDAPVLVTLANLKQALAKDEPFDRLISVEKAFIEFAKSFAVICVAASNTLNILACTLAFGGHQFPRLTDMVTQIILGFAIAMFPFTIFTAAFTHSTVYLTQHVNFVSILVLLEYGHLITMCCLMGYYFTHASRLLVLLPAISISVIVMITFYVIFERPSVTCGPRLKSTDAGAG